MVHVYQYLFPAMWLGWLVYWWAAARNVKATARHESVRSRLLHIVPLGIAAALLFVPRSPIEFLGARFLPFSPWPFWAGAAITLAGLLFTVWARARLGGNWSATITVKENHELVTGGPYRIVRHPIYSGLLLAFVGSALARGEWRGALAVLLVAWTFWRKLGIEERWMRERFGAAYDEYARRVPALVPFIR